jgi:hypothetical protein
MQQKPLHTGQLENHPIDPPGLKTSLSPAAVRLSNGGWRSGAKPGILLLK